MSDEPRADVLRHTADIVSAHAGHNDVSAEALPALIQSVYRALSGLGADPEPSIARRPEPAVPIRKSVFPDYIVCLEDGARMKMMKRYLMKRYGLSPAAYRDRWGLPADYPMVAPNYTEKRSSLARQIGLGRKRVADKPSMDETAVDEPETDDAVADEAMAGKPEADGPEAVEAALEPDTAKASRKSAKPRSPRRKTSEVEAGE